MRPGALNSFGLPHISVQIGTQISTQAPASRVGRDFEAISTQSHAAPAPRPLLAGVMKVRSTH